MDYSLEAMLTFDQLTIEKIKADYSSLSVELHQLNRDAFKFDWLSKDILASINNYNSIQYDISLFKNGNGAFIILDNKTILLYHLTA